MEVGEGGAMCCCFVLFFGFFVVGVSCQTKVIVVFIACAFVWLTIVTVSIDLDQYRCCPVKMRGRD